MSKRTREDISIDVGPMFGSKTLSLIDKITAHEAVERNVLVIKPANDFRFGLDRISSRGGISHSAQAVNIDDMEGLSKLICCQDPPPDVLAIDELQFFDPEIAEVIKETAQNGIPVIAAGLHRDYRGNPFPTMEKVMPLATSLNIVTARCMFRDNGSSRPCGDVAHMTQRLLNAKPDSYNSETVIIEEPGTAITYQARCLDHWQVRDMPQKRLVFGK